MSITHIKQIRDVFSYSRRFRENIFVIYLDDGLFKSHALDMLVKDIKHLLDARIKVVLVPDITNTVQALTAHSNYTIEYKNGIYVGTQDTIEILQNAAFSTASQLLAKCAHYKQVAVIGNWTTARGHGVIDGIDYQHAGTLDKIDYATIYRLLDSQIIPIVPAISWSHTGKPYSLCATEAAAELSNILGASKLFFMLDKSQITVAKELSIQEDMEQVDISDDGVIRCMTVQSAKEIIVSNGFRTETCMGNILRVSINTLDHGLDRVHILDGNEEGSLLVEVFFDQGSGFMIYADEYQSIYPMQLSDIDDVLALMRPFIASGVLVHRDASTLKSTFHDYIVYKVDGKLHGTAALHAMDKDSAEIAGLAVSNDYNKSGVGKRLIAYLLCNAKKLNFSRVFSLTKSTGDWFERMGFVRTRAQELPTFRLEQYHKTKRNSHVYIFDLNDLSRDER